MKNILRIIREFFNSKKTPLDKYATPIFEEPDKRLEFSYSDFSIYITLDDRNKSRFFIPAVIERDIEGSLYFSGIMVDDNYSDLINIVVSDLLKGEENLVNLTPKMIFTAGRVCDNFKVPEWKIAAILNAVTCSTLSHDDLINAYKRGILNLTVKAKNIESVTSFIYLIKECDLQDIPSLNPDTYIKFKAKIMNKGKELFLARKREQILN